MCVYLCVKLAAFFALCAAVFSLPSSIVYEVFFIDDKAVELLKAPQKLSAICFLSKRYELR